MVQPLPIERMRSGRRRRPSLGRGLAVTMLVLLLVGLCVLLWSGFSARSADTVVTTTPSSRVAPINQAALLATRERQRGELSVGVMGIGSAATIELSPPLRLQMVRDSWVEVVDAQGSRLEHNLLRAGEQHDFDGQPPFSVLLSQGGAAEMWFYGQPVNVDPAHGNGLLRLKIGDDQLGDNQRLSIAP